MGKTLYVMDQILAVKMRLPQSFLRLFADLLASPMVDSVNRLAIVAVGLDEHHCLSPFEHASLLDPKCRSARI